MYIPPQHCSCSTVIAEGTNWFSPRKTEMGWNISLLTNILLQRLQGRVAFKPVPGTRLSILESKNHSPVPNSNNTPQSLPGWLAVGSTTLRWQHKQGPRIHDLSDPAEALLHKIWVPITGTGSLNSSFHLVSTAPDRLSTQVLAQQFHLLRGAAPRSSTKTGTETVKTHGTSSSSWPYQQSRIKSIKSISPIVCESRARHSSTL